MVSTEFVSSGTGANFNGGSDTTDSGNPNSNPNTVTKSVPDDRPSELRVILTEGTTAAKFKEVAMALEPQDRSGTNISNAIECVIFTNTAKRQRWNSRFRLPNLAS